MAKKKVTKKVTKKSPSKKSHGELFDKHNNLIWLLPIFFIVAVVAIMAINNSFSPSIVDENVVLEESNLIDVTGIDSSSPAGTAPINP